MSKYTVEDSQTGKRITFEWNAPQPPTDSDLQEIFSEAGQKRKKGVFSILQKGSDILEPGRQTVPASSFLQKIATATRETFVPKLEALKRLFSPQVGQFGLSRLAQEQGEKLQDSVSAVSPTAGALLPQLTPRSAAEQIGAGAIAEIAAPVSIAKLDKSIFAPFQQMLTGIPGREWLALSKNLKSLRPSFLGGAPSKEAAGAAIGKAEEAAGLFQPVLPTNLGKEYASKFLETLTKYTPTGLNRNLTDKELSDPKVIEKIIEELTPNEAYTLREAVKNTLDSWVQGKFSKEYMRYARLKDVLNSYIGKLTPTLRKAQAVFADSAQREKFFSLFPLTKYGQPAIGRLGFAGMVAGATAYGDPVSMAKRALSVLSLTSPTTNTIFRTIGTIGARSAKIAGKAPPRTFIEMLREKGEEKKQQ